MWLAGASLRAMMGMRAPLLLLAVGGTAHAQQLANPSFEGDTVDSYTYMTPTGWEAGGNVVQVRQRRPWRPPPRGLSRAAASHRSVCLVRVSRVAQPAARADTERLGPVGRPPNTRRQLLLRRAGQRQLRPAEHPRAGALRGLQRQLLGRRAPRIRQRRVDACPRGRRGYPGQQPPAGCFPAADRGVRGGGGNRRHAPL